MEPNGPGHGPALPGCDTCSLEDPLPPHTDGRQAGGKCVTGMLSCFPMLWPVLINTEICIVTVHENALATHFCVQWQIYIVRFLIQGG